MAIGHQRLASSSSAASDTRAFARDVLAGLSARQKCVPCKYLYDAAGSRIIREIMDLPEYYLTRSETEVLQGCEGALAERMAGEPFQLVDLGAGDGRKTSILIEGFERRGLAFDFYSIDISETASRDLALALSRSFPDLGGATLIAEYASGLAWLAQHGRGRSLVLFLGSNIGNLSRAEAVAFLQNLWLALGDGDLLLVGFDLRKDVETMQRAYADSRGVTERFNLNLLARMNRELAAEFDESEFRFYSTWEPRSSAIESYLLSARAQSVLVRGLGREFHFDAWEPIHTESSRKYSLADLAALAAETGFAVEETYLDPKGWFADGLWRVEKSARKLQPSAAGRASSRQQ